MCSSASRSTARPHRAGCSTRERWATERGRPDEPEGPARTPDRAQRTAWRPTRTATTAYRQLGDKHGEASAWNNLGATLKGLRRFEEAEQAHRTATTTYRQLDDKLAEARAWNNLGAALRGRGEFEPAVGGDRGAVAMFEVLGDEHRRGEALEEFAATPSAAGWPSDVVRAVRQDSAEAYRRAGAEEEAARVLDMDGE
ncbi:tetratricopeptide repeat protein [Streptomyces sp. LS1784]|uniref:tetratricopeptide repeat protein n=1 Tax=Streptomyces sp. LS1784 TaxID=2851533 RepID=UPI001CCD7D0C